MAPKPPSPGAPKHRRKIPASKGVASKMPGKTGFDAAADMIADLLRQNNMSVSDLARASTVSRVAISNWIHGNRPLRADYLLALFAVFGDTVSFKVSRKD